MPDAYARAFPPDELARHQSCSWARRHRGRVESRSTTGAWRCTLVEPDRTGLLATAAGALALVGFDIDTAAAYGHPGGLALEVFTGRDRFGRLAHARAARRARPPR